jgi:hypothetical protein
MFCCKSTKGHKNTRSLPPFLRSDHDEHHKYDQAKPHGTERVQRVPSLRRFPNREWPSWENIHLCSKARSTRRTRRVLFGGELPAVVLCKPASEKHVRESGTAIATASGALWAATTCGPLSFPPAPPPPPRLLPGVEVAVKLRDRIGWLRLGVKGSFGFAGAACRVPVRRAFGPGAYGG